MDKIKNTLKNNKEERFTMETVACHNGVLVDIIMSESYEQTEFDNIIADWKRQNEKRRKKEKIKLIHLFTGKRERSDIA